jgi:hypothetical protein
LLHERPALVVGSFAIRRLQSFHGKVPWVANLAFAERLIPIRNALIGNESLYGSANAFPHGCNQYHYYYEYVNTFFLQSAFTPAKVQSCQGNGRTANTANGRVVFANRAGMLTFQNRSPSRVFRPSCPCTNPPSTVATMNGKPVRA